MGNGRERMGIKRMGWDDGYGFCIIKVCIVRCYCI